MKIGRIILTNTLGPKETADTYSEEIEKFITKTFEEPTEFVRLTAANSDELQAALLKLCDVEKCPLVVTNGGTGPGRRDIAPETTRQVLDKELPGFGEIMRYYSYEKKPTAILSRAIAGIRGESLIVNLPTRPKAVKACLYLLREAIAETIEQISGKTCVLYVDPITIPLEKYLPFLRYFRPKAVPPNFDLGHPTI